MMEKRCEMDECVSNECDNENCDEENVGRFIRSAGMMTVMMDWIDRLDKSKEELK